MTPAARTQAAIDLLDEIIAAARSAGPAADTILARWFATRRYAGSKDRRAIRELVYAAIRLVGEVPPSGRAAILALAAGRPELLATFDGSAYGPAPIRAEEPVARTGHAPRWLEEALERSGVGSGERAALLERAPLDVRVNTLRSTVGVVQEALPGAERIEGVPDALRLPPDTAVERTSLWRGGAIEVQDAGSQIVAAAAGVQPGMAVVDLCAGAGGKTLALAAAMRNHGAILATDTDRTRLQRLIPRAERAGVAIAETRLLNPGSEADALEDWQERADAVLIDAPCSGTGTWRRNPEARWRLTPERLERLVAMQARLLELGGALVRAGGSLTYIVCSLLDAEGAAQVERFLQRNPQWRVEPLALPRGMRHAGGMRLTPASSSTDGFFVTKLVRPC